MQNAIMPKKGGVLREMAQKGSRPPKLGGGRELDFIEARARRLMREGKFEEAVRELEEALKKASEDELRLRELLGRCYLEMGRLHEALAVFSKVLEGSPLSPGALLGLAEALERDGRRARALRAYKKLLALNPSDPEVKRKVEELERQLARSGGGLSPEQVEKVEEHLSDARFYLQMGQTRRARAEAEEALNLDPDNVEAHLIVAEALIAEGEPGRARPHIERVLQLEPENKTARELMKKAGL